MIVIIPEGIETLYSASSGDEVGHAETLSLARRSAVPMADIFPGAYEYDIWRRYAREGEDNIPSFGPPEGWTGKTGPDPKFTQGDSPSSDEGHDEQSSVDPPAHDPSIPPSDDRLGAPPDSHSDEGRDPHAWVGISLILGFILMYLIDTIPKHATSPSQPTPSYISLGSFSLNRSATDADADAAAPTSHNHSRASSTTVGLVIHAAADGIALGASSTTTSRLSFIIFLAIMIHKAPAAFGLTSVLLKQGLTKRTARTHLIVFSLAAPAGAIATWVAAHILGGFGGETEFATGVLLLFSGGTFLYVAMHTMQDPQHEHGDAQTNGFGDPAGDGLYMSQPAPAKPAGPGLTETLATVGGMLLPLLTQFGHVH